MTQLEDGPRGTRMRPFGALLVVVGAVALTGFATPATAQAAFGVQSFQAGVCDDQPTLYPTPQASAPTCSTYATQAGEHPYYGVTSFTMNNSGAAPDGTLKDVRVDLPPGLIPNPQATAKCTAALPSSSTCSASQQLGVVYLTAYISGLGQVGPLTTGVYNMQPADNTPADFAFTIPLINQRVDIIGGVRWHADNNLPGDYGEYFTINGLPQNTPTITSTLVFFGDPGQITGSGNTTPFLTNPSTCAGPQTTYLTVDSYENAGQYIQTHFTTPVGAGGCDALTFGSNLPTVGFAPVGPDNSMGGSVAHDAPMGLSTTLHVPQSQAPAPALATPQVQDADVTLPPGVNINPAAATGVTPCTDAQLGAGTGAPITCPIGSILGTASITTPVLAAPLTGYVYLGNPIPGGTFRVFVDASSTGPVNPGDAKSPSADSCTTYTATGCGVDVRLVGTISPDPATGQITAKFDNNPQVPFSDFTLTFDGSAAVPGEPGPVLASPMSCGVLSATSSITPYSGSAAATPSGSITVDNDGKGAPCPAPLPFAPGAAVSESTHAALAHTTLDTTFVRPDGQDFLSQIHANLPPGLTGTIPSVPLCPDAQAQSGGCPAASQIGTATVQSGTGGNPLTLSGPVYLTGPYGGAPYGMSIQVPAIAGPYNLGTVIARAQINVDPTTAALDISSTLPSIVQGVPLRLRSVKIDVNRNSFLFNGTNCGPLSAGGSFVSASGATAPLQPVSLQFTGCAALAFAPKLTASTDSRSTSADGAALTVKVTAPAGGANLHSVAVSLPTGMVARLSTLQKACLQATFDADPAKCPTDSIVGAAKAITPVLPTPLTGRVYIVSHGGAGLPSLEVVLYGSNVRIDLTGSIGLSSSGVTTSTFGTVPDVPISNFTLDLPRGPHSALTATRKLCGGAPPIMPTTLIGQNGKTIKKDTRLSVAGCGVHGVSLLSHRYHRGRLILRVRVHGTGRVTVSGRDLHGSVHARAARARNGAAGKQKSKAKNPTAARVVTLRPRLSRRALASLRRHHHVRVSVRITFHTTHGRTLRVTKRFTVRLPRRATRHAPRFVG